MNKQIDDKIFKEYDIRGKFPECINEPVAYALGLAFAELSKVKKAIIGRDARPESEKAFWAFLTGLTDGGFEVDDIGVCSTAELFFATGFKKHDLGIMITASHNPKGQTGFKFCDISGLALGSGDRYGKLKELANREYEKLDKDRKEYEPNSEKVKFLSVAKDYRDFALSFIDSEKIKDLKVVLDASNGSGGRLAEVVFNALPIEAYYFNFKFDEINPDHDLNPMLEENRQTAKREVVNNKADLGVVFDGDADRAIFVDESGEFIEPYYINCLLVEIMLVAGKIEEALIDGRLGLLLSKIIENNGGKVLKHRSGYINFIRSMDDNKILFGCENSGHFLFNFLFKNESNFVYSDAIIPILIIGEFLKSNKIKLSELINKYKKEVVVSGEINFKGVDFLAISDKLKEVYLGNEFEEFDGLTVIDKNKKWFFNVRPSQTEPLVRLNIEASSQLEMNDLKNSLASLIESFKI